MMAIATTFNQFWTCTHIRFHTTSYHNSTHFATHDTLCRGCLGTFGIHGTHLQRSSPFLRAWQLFFGLGNFVFSTIPDSTSRRRDGGNTNQNKNEESRNLHRLVCLSLCFQSRLKILCLFLLTWIKIGTCLVMDPSENHLFNNPLHKSLA